MSVFQRIVAVILTCALVWIWLSATSPRAAAQTATITALTGQSCAGTRFGNDLICTSNDFSSNLAFTQPSSSTLTSCIAGQTVSVDVIASITSSSPLRYDGAYFIGEVGNSPSLNNAANSCSLGVFPNTPSPFLNQDSDSCGDFAASSSASLLIQGVTVKCTPATGTNLLAIPYTLVFNNQAGSTACTPSNVTANTAAKCISSTASTLTGVGVQGYITLTKQANPDGASQSFAFTTSASPSATITPSSFNLSDNGSQTVQVPLEPTGGTRTLTLTETLATGWDANASISCTTPSGGSASSYVTVNNATRTITANLSATNFGALCTITNTKLPTLTLTKVSNGGVGTFNFTGTNGFGSDAITTVTSGTGVAGATKTLTAASTATTITETIPAGYVLAAASCTGMGSGGTATLAGNVLTLNAAATAAGSNIACSFVNDVQAPQLSVTKTASAAGVNAAGASITYTIAVSNTGNVAISSIAVSDALGTVTCPTSGNATIATLSPGQSESCSLTYVVTQADFDNNGGGDGDIDNTATASGSFGGSGVTANASTAVTLIRTSQLTIVKTANTAGPVAVNDVIAYTYTVANTGNLTLNGVNVSDIHNGYGTLPVPAGEALTSDQAPLGDSTDATANGSWDTLAPGDTITFTANYTVTQADVDLLQ